MPTTRLLGTPSRASTVHSAHVCVLHGTGRTHWHTRERSHLTSYTHTCKPFVSAHTVGPPPRALTASFSLTVSRGGHRGPASHVTWAALRPRRLGVTPSRRAQPAAGRAGGMALLSASRPLRVSDHSESSSQPQTGLRPLRPLAAWRSSRPQTTQRLTTRSAGGGAHTSRRLRWWWCTC